MTRDCPDCEALREEFEKLCDRMQIILAAQSVLSDAVLLADVKALMFHGSTRYTLLEATAALSALRWVLGWDTAYTPLLLEKATQAVKAKRVPAEEPVQ